MNETMSSHLPIDQHPISPAAPVEDRFASVRAAATGNTPFAANALGAHAPAAPEFKVSVADVKKDIDAEVHARAAKAARTAVNAFVGYDTAADLQNRIDVANEAAERERKQAEKRFETEMRTWDLIDKDEDKKSGKKTLSRV